MAVGSRGLRQGCSLAATITLAKYGRRRLASCWRASKGTRRLCIAASSTIRSGTLLSPSDKIATGSCDHTAKIWDPNGLCVQTIRGHEGEVVCLKFDPNGLLLATGSLDSSVLLSDLETGKTYLSLREHESAVVNLMFSAEGDILTSGSFDCTAKVWDIRTGKCVVTLREHEAEVCNSNFNFSGDLMATGSLDKYSISQQNL